jgi:hypothetical protein
MSRIPQIALLLVFCSFFFFSQRARSETGAPNSAVVTFTIDFPTSQPEHYSIRIPSVGLGHCKSKGRISADSDTTDDFDLDFPITSETRQRMFELAEKAGYFEKDLDSHHKGLAFTGKKTLSYGDGTHSGSSSYNFSSNPAVQELTSLMQSLSSTIEIGHRLQYDRQYQKLALDEELKRMEDLAHSNELVEVTAVEQILEQIIADPAVLNVTRARAQRLLARSATR